MLYRFFYYVVNLGLRFFYRRIYANGLQNMKKNQAYIIACNHPAGFMEPLLAACLSPIDLYFLVRGDLFENKILKPILVSTHQLPIFRFRDGFSSLRQNQKTIDKVVDTLAENKAVMIFVEGSTQDTFTIRPLQKGLARIGFQTMEKYPDLDLQILPMGTTFNHVGHIGCDVIIQAGKPFSARPFFTDDPKEQPAAMSRLLEATENEMKKLIVQESKKASRSYIRDVWKSLTISRKESFFRRVEWNGDFFDKLNEQISTGKKPEVHVSDANYISGKRNLWSAFLTPLAAVGYLFMAIPSLVAINLRKRLVKKIEFKSPIAFVSGFFLSLIMFVALIIATWIQGGIWVCTGVVISLLVCLLAYAFVWENYHK